MKNSVIIRSAKQKDMDMVILLSQAHANHEKTDYSLEGKKEKLSSLLFGSKKTLWCYLAEVDNEIVGYATCNKEPSTWTGVYFMHMDCLYLTETFRGKGVGKLLIEEIEKLAKKEGCMEVQWQTPVFNKPAIRFYNKLGASSKKKLRFYYNNI